MKHDSHNAIYRCLGLVVKSRRRKLGLSQEELAEETGVDRSFISNIEGGKRNPSFGTVSDIAQGLKMKYSRLIQKCELCVESKELAS